MMIDKNKEPQFSQPFKQILLMVFVLVLVGVLAAFIYPLVAPVLAANPYLNGFILFVFGVGVIACFWQVIQLISSVSWIEGFALDRPGHEFVRAPRLLASLSALLSNTRARRGLTSTSTGSILDSVATRLDEARDITRYIVNLLIFLGLLGTFYGLAVTVPAVVETIQSLNPSESEEGVAVFDRLMVGLGEQMDGMGTAFSSSLLGLAGSLVVGMLELFAGHGQNRFYMELEEWLSSITRVGFATEPDAPQAPAYAPVAGGDPAAGQQIMEMRDFLIRSEERRAETDARLLALTESITRLSDRLASQTAQSPGFDTSSFERLAASQETLASSLNERADDAGGLDAETRMRLRNIDVQLLRILEEMSAGRQDSVAELRAEIAALAQAITQRG